jgi:hypothetical protein
MILSGRLGILMRTQSPAVPACYQSLLQNSAAAAGDQ